MVFLLMKRPLTVENHTWYYLAGLRKAILCRNASRSANSWFELGEVLDLKGVPKAQLIESSAVESTFSPPSRMVPNYFVFAEINKNGPLVSLNVALQSVFQFHKGLYLQTLSVT